MAEHGFEIASPAQTSRSSPGLVASGFPKVQFGYAGASYKSTVDYYTFDTVLCEEFTYLFSRT